MKPPLQRLLLALLAAALIAPESHAQDAAPVQVVEFHNAAQDHYFITSAPGEIADLDRGVHAGWVRTGLGFQVYPSAAPGTSAVCRFYLPPALGDSHFYSASPSECTATQSRFPGFVEESPDVFAVALPDPVTGACANGTIPVYRLWNGRADTNHRYTTDRVAWQHLRDLGWIAEGYGDGQVIMCSPIPASATVDVAVGGLAVIKVRAAGGSVVMLEERLNSIFEPGPQRTLAFVMADGHGTRDWHAPPGWSVADFCVHPSGEVSVVLTTATAVRLVRLDRDAGVRWDAPLPDPAAPFDPFLDFDGSIRNDDALQPVLTHDAARLAPLGEDLAVVLRTGRNAVVAYRLNVDGSGSYRGAWRTLVEPGSSIDGVFLSSGSFDTFGQLANHVMVHMDAGADGTIAVGLVESPFRNFVFPAHAAYFGEPVAAQAGIVVTRIAGSDGRRLGSTVVDTRQLAELHGLRATAQGFVAVGRVRTEIRADGTGWDAFVAALDSHGAITTYQVLDLDRGDVVFDAALLADGQYLAIGTTGYVQNPSGASISEDTQPLLALLDAAGKLVARIPVADGPRQDQLRTLVPLDGRWLLGGMRNGPGTHSGDAAPELIAADGFLVEIRAAAGP